MGSRTFPQARLLFKDAFDSLEQTINASNPEDARVLQNTTLQDVHDAARKLEQELGARQCLRNMARVVPFLEALEHYSKTVDVLCNGTPYLPFIWAPIKLILQVASDFTSALEKLISAYSKIAEILPRFDRLSSAFRGNADFQRVLATVYADILRFHEEAYKVFRKPGWKIFFDISWARFDRRFKAILDSLANHSDLVDREANAIDIAEAREQRKRAIEEATRQEEERSIIQFQAALAWLEVKDYQQDDELDHQSSLHHADSCNWILKNKKAASWMQLGNKAPVLWLKGKPGAGKSVLSSMIIRFLQQDKHSTILYYFCTYDSSKPNNCSHILRSLTAQILRSNRDLAVFVYDNYIRPGYTSSILQLKKLIPTLLSSIPSVRVVIDGLDEFEQKDQKQILSDLIPFASVQNSNAVCKILFASRDIPTIAGHLSKQTIVCLSEEREPVTRGIRSYVSHRLGEIRLNFGAKIGGEVMDGVERNLIEKAEGMFLWVRLVLCTLERVHSVRQLNDVVRDLPKGLETVYDTILGNIRRQMIAQDCGEAVRVLEWVAVAKRRLKKFELLDGVSLHEGNSLLDEDTRLWESVIDLCKPLIEEGPNGTIVFVHFTVREYLLRASRNALVKPINAHHNISLACIAYLRTSFNFIDPQFPEEQNNVNLVKGFHGLYLYANEYWPTHLIIYANMRGDTEPLSLAPDSLMGHLIALWEVHNHIETKLLRDPRPNEVFLSTTDIGQALPNLVRHPRVLELIQTTVGFRTSLKSEQRKSGEDAEAVELKKDPTLFSLILYNYKQIVNRLLKAKAITDFSPGTLDLFKARYESSANTCRFRGCPRATDGYSTKQLLEEHEGSHTGGIKCAEPSCSFSRIGFKNSAGLKRHINEFHATPETVIKPTVVRRQFVCGGNISEGTTPNLWGCAQHYARQDELNAHFRSPLGRRCIKQYVEAHISRPDHSMMVDGIPPGVEQALSRDQVSALQSKISPGQQDGTTPQQRLAAQVPQMALQNQPQIDPRMSSQLVQQAQEGAAAAAQGHQLNPQVRARLIPPGLPDTAKKQLMNVSDEDFRAVIRRLSNVPNNANQTPGFPGNQPQMGQPSMLMNPQDFQMGLQGNQLMNSANINAQRIMQPGQQAPGSMNPPQVQLQQTQQQTQQQQRRRIMSAQQMLKQNLHLITKTDPKPFPPNILSPMVKQNLPEGVKTWAQLKEWAIWNPALAPNIDIGKLLLLQAMHVQDMSGQRTSPQSNNVGAVPNAQPGGQAPQAQGMPPHPPITPQDIQNLRARLPPAQARLTDDQLRNHITNQRMAQWKKQQAQRLMQQGLQGQANQMPQQPPQDTPWPYLNTSYKAT